jgi:hypothetical protein
MAKYVNKSTNNIFTEAGRCMPGETVELSTEQAKAYPGLEAISAPKKKAAVKEEEKASEE